MTGPAKLVTPALIDDLAVISRCNPNPEESPEDYLVRLVWFMKERSDQLESQIETADDLLAEMLRDAERLPVFRSFVQTCCAIVPLVPLIVLLGRLVVVYAIWLAVVCMAPIAFAATFNLYCRNRPIGPAPAKAGKV